MLVALFLMHASFLMLTQPTYAAVSNVFRFDPITVVEEPPIGTLILDLASKLNINDLASFDYKFRFYSPHSLTSHYFLIDQLTGHVKTQRSLDREYLCETKVCGSCHTNTNCTLPVEIVLNSGTRGNHHEQQKFVSFDVIIEDKNEFAPQFPHAQIQLNASEGAPPNFEIPLEPARDRDSQPVDIVYTLVPNMVSNLNDDSSLDIEDTREYQQQLEKLNAQVRLSTPTPTQLSLILLEPFDYETIKELSFKIVASDRRVKSNADATALSGSCLVTLKIIDINDNLPIFDRTEYEYRLDESQALPDTRLIRVHATDLDDGLNGLVKYSLVDQTFTVNQQLTQTVRVRDLFKIDETNGWISVGDEFSLDYEQMPTYRLTVKAQDSGVSNSMPVYANVIIYLNDVNDNRPQINLTLPSQSAEEEDIYLRNNKIEISEWTMSNSFLAQISVSDGDSGANGKVKLDLKQFKVKTGHHHLTHSQHLLEESNDFSLVHLFNNIYSLMTKHKLDRELYDKYLIDIIATDHGQPTPLQSTFSLEIGIRDENDNAPKFLENVYEFDLMELQSLSKEENEGLSFGDEWISVGQVKAVDFDLNDNAQIKYDIELSNQDTCKVNKEYFQIDPQTGLVEAKKAALDRELCERYEFKLTATDNPSQVTSSTLEKKSNTAHAQMYINLLDLNDNAPKFQKEKYIFKLSENILFKKYFGRVKAIDADKPNTTYSSVNYSILLNTKEDDQINGTFTIDSLTGELIQLKQLDFEKKQFYEFSVIAYDNMNSSGNSLSSTCLIRIDVIDLNDNSPVFTSPIDSKRPTLIILNVTEANTKKDWLRLSASDLDASSSGKLVFNIEKQIKLKQKADDSRQNGNFKQHQYFNLFECNSITGQISLKPFSPTNNRHQKLDESNENRQEQLLGTYALLVKVSDTPKADTDLSLSSRAILFIHLTDSNVNGANKTSSQLKLLKRIINESSDAKDDVDRSLNKIIYAYSYAIANGKILGASAITSLTQQDSFTQLKNELLNLAFNGKNYKFFVAFAIAACLMICFIVSSLCLTIYFYKQRKSKEKFPASSNKKRAPNSNEIYNYASVNKDKNNFGEFECLNADLQSSQRNSSSNSSSASTTSSTSLTKTTNSTAASAQLITNSTRNTNLIASSVSSVSPASTNNSSESNQKFYTTNYESLQMNYSSIDSSSNTLDKNNLKGNTFVYGDEPNYSSVFKNKNVNFDSNKHQPTTLLRINKSKINRTPAYVHCSNSENEDDEAEAERAILIVNTNSPTDTNNFSSNHSSRSSTTSNALLNHTDTTSNNTSLTNKSVSIMTKSTPKKIVASAESLSSVHTLSQSQSPQKECVVISPNSQTNFKTFKTLTLTSSSTTNSPSHHQAYTNTLQQSPNSPYNKKTTNTTSSYRTMPSHNKVINSFDQKPLNLPVNELFKRYELKRQAADLNTNINESIQSNPKLTKQI